MERVSGLLYDGTHCPLCGEAIGPNEDANEVVAVVQFPVERKGTAIRVRTHTECDKGGEH